LVQSRYVIVQASSVKKRAFSLFRLRMFYLITNKAFHHVCTVHQ